MTTITERDHPAMDSDSKKMKLTYEAAMSGEWQRMIDYYDSHFSDLVTPVTYSEDTALHVAVCSQKEQPLKYLLDNLSLKNENVFQEELLKGKNEYGNTVLHEATIYGNFEAVKLLVERCPDLVSITNNYGETPLFTAAEFSEAKIVKFLLLSLPQEIVDKDGRLPSIHRQRSYKDNLSILSAAILGQHYETALMLLELDGSLHEMADQKGVTALHLLANTPSAFESGYPMELHERLIYCCLPVVRRYKIKWPKETSDQARQGLGDLESGLERNRGGGLLNYLNIHIKGYWPARLKRFWDEKRKHVFSLRLAGILIKKDMSWNPVEGQGRRRVAAPIVKTGNVMGEDKKEEERGPSVPAASLNQSTDESDTESEQDDHKPLKSRRGIKEELRHGRAQTSATKSSSTSKAENPLFAATRNGIQEIVKEIIQQHPQAIEFRNDMRQSILDVAVMHRKKEIFSFVTQKKIPLARLRRLIDEKGNTLLHHVADMKHYKGGTKPGPALQLQEELQWLEQVRHVIPSHYVTLQNEKGETADELFKEKHQRQLQSAQEWIKQTTQSCSTVAALVATVVFAAAYTVPGGSDNNGTPNFIHSPYFLVFTVSDVVSLASSLTSLVVFLSLLTSPFEQQDFLVSIPRKLIVGFTFLFFSVITTMLSFGATILILIQSERKLTTFLLSIAAFLPVLVFAIMQFRLYVSFMGSTFNFLKITAKAIPSCLVPRLPGGEKLC